MWKGMPGAMNDDNVNWFTVVAPVLQLCVQQAPDGNELQLPLPLELWPRQRLCIVHGLQLAQTFLSRAMRLAGP